MLTKDLTPYPRRSGVLLHISSLPGDYGIGDLGRQAYQFIDFLEKSHQKLWQVLPLGPTGYGNIPYSNLSSFAGNELFLSLEMLVDDGLISSQDIESRKFKSKKTDFDQAQKVKFQLFKLSFENFKKLGNFSALDKFTSDNQWWLNDYSLYRVLKEKHHLTSWIDWKKEYRQRDPKFIKNFKEKNVNQIKLFDFLQFQFLKQWGRLKSYANNKGIEIIGDIPIYVAYDSADTWSNQELFDLDKSGNMIHIAGCPPDHFSETGQRWGNPIYNWNVHEQTEYSWWINRITWTLKLTDVARIDHFRGFEDYWQIPASEKTAVNGKWIKGPSDKFFKTIYDKLGNIPLIAEDLGLLSPKVYQLRDKFNLPGMKILHYAFNSQRDEKNPFLPHNHVVNSIVYTGNHDNDTTLGWFESIDDKTKQHFLDYTRSDGNEPVWSMICLALSSVAHTAIISMQDLLELNGSARMNLPGGNGNNWVWKYEKDDLKTSISDKLQKFTKLYGR